MRIRCSIATIQNLLIVITNAISLEHWATLNSFVYGTYSAKPYPDITLYSPSLFCHEVGQNALTKMHMRTHELCALRTQSNPIGLMTSPIVNIQHLLTTLANLACCEFVDGTYGIPQIGALTRRCTKRQQPYSNEFCLKQAAKCKRMKRMYNNWGAQDFTLLLGRPQLLFRLVSFFFFPLNSCCFVARTNTILTTKTSPQKKDPFSRTMLLLSHLRTCCGRSASHGLPSTCYRQLLSKKHSATHYCEQESKTKLVSSERCFSSFFCQPHVCHLHDQLTTVEIENWNGKRAPLLPLSPGRGMRARN